MNTRTFLRRYKAQVRMGETLMVLFMFFILLVFGLVLYVKLSGVSARMKQQENRALSAVAIEQQIRFLSEIQCTQGGSVQFDCYDLSKVAALGAVYDQHLGYYQRLFGRANITFTQTFPVPQPPLPDTIILYEETEGATSAQPFYTPVTLYDPLSDSMMFGYLKIEVYK